MVGQNNLVISSQTLTLTPAVLSSNPFLVTHPPTALSSDPTNLLANRLSLILMFRKGKMQALLLPPGTALLCSCSCFCEPHCTGAMLPRAALALAANVEAMENAVNESEVSLGPRECGLKESN